MMMQESNHNINGDEHTSQWYGNDHADAIDNSRGGNDHGGHFDTFRLMIAHSPMHFHFISVRITHMLRCQDHILVPTTIHQLLFGSVYSNQVCVSSAQFHGRRKPHSQALPARGCAGQPYGLADSLLPPVWRLQSAPAVLPI